MQAKGIDANPYAIARVIAREGTQLFKKGGNELQFQLVMANVEKLATKRLEVFYEGVVRGSIEDIIRRA